MVLLPRRALVNAELFTPVWPRAELPNVEPADMCLPVREPVSALWFIRGPCILETARLGEIEELRALLDLDGEDALTLEDPTAVPARVVPAGPPCAQAKLRFPALPDALVERVEPVGPVAPLTPAKECHWPSAEAELRAVAPGLELRAIEPAPGREPAGGLATELPPR